MGDAIHLKEREVTDHLDSDAENEAKSPTDEQTRMFPSPSLENDTRRRKSSKEKDGTTEGMSKFGIWKNHLIVCVTYMLLLTAHSSFENLQSTLNSEESLGVAGLTVLYLTFACSSLFLVVFTTSRVSNKRIMVISMATYVLYICTGFYSSWATVIPAVIVMGIGAGHLWVVQQVYTTALAEQYAAITKSKVEDANHFFFGIFSGFLSLRYLWGNLVSSIILRAEAVNQTDTMESCGAEFCPHELNNTRVQPPTAQQLYTYVGILVGFDCLAVAISIIFLTSIRDTHADKPSLTATMRAVFVHIYKSRTQKLCLVTSVYRGLQVAFIEGHFNMAFVSCPLGISYVGLVTIAFGTTASLGAFIAGKVAQYTGLLFLYVIAFVAQGSVALTLLLWELDPNKPEIIFVLVTLWGVGDAVYGPIVVSMHSVLFTESNSSAVFSTFRLCDSLGYAISFALASFLCIRPTIIFMLVAMSLSLTCMAVLLWGKRTETSL